MSSNIVCCMGTKIPSLIYHFLRYYTNLKVDNFNIIIHASEKNDNLKKSIEILNQFNIEPKEIWIGQFTLELEELKLNNMRNNIGAYDWIINLDLDEFIKLPKNFNTISDFLLYCDMNNYSYVSGILVDRISESGDFLEITLDKNLFSEFPVECHITDKILGGCIDKIPMMKGNLVVGDGHHHLKNIKSDIYNYPEILNIYHFKWDITILDRLCTFTLDEKISNRYYYKECNTFMEYIKKNKKINIYDVISNKKLIDISICAAVMNKIDFLLESIPTWLDLPVREIIIVDWSSEIPIANEIFNRFSDNRLTILRVDDKKYYNQSKASNLKIRYSKSKYVISIDCDIKLNKNFFNTYNLKILDSKCFFHGDVNIHPGTTGTCLITREMFNELNGYNELMNGWGYHDIDFYNRARSKGYLENCFKSNSLIHIDHSDDIRVTNYEVKSKKISNSENRKISEKNQWNINNNMELYDTVIYNFGKEPERKII